MSASIILTKLGFTTTLTEEVSVNLSYRRKGDSVWIVIPVNPHIVDINRFLIPSLTISGLLASTIYEVRAQNVCGGPDYIEDITTPDAACPVISDIIMSTIIG